MNKKKKNILLCSSHNLSIFGFWLYLMSDFIIFSVLFVVYIIMSRHGYQNFLKENHLFSQFSVFMETLILLFSSLTCSLAKYFFKNNNKFYVLFFLFITFILGLIFINIEFCDCIDIFHKGFYPSTNGYFSSLFVLLGMHGLHIVIGLLWIMVMILQIYYLGLNNFTYVALTCLSLFWHFLDIIWIILIMCVYFK